MKEKVIKTEEKKHFFIFYGTEKRENEKLALNVQRKKRKRNVLPRKRKRRRQKLLFDCYKKIRKKVIASKRENRIRKRHCLKIKNRK